MIGEFQSVLCFSVSRPVAYDRNYDTTMLTIKILFTINSLKKKEKTIHSKTLFTIPVELKST